MSADATLIYFVIGILISLLAWTGNRVHNKIDDLTGKLDSKMETLTNKVEEKLDEVNQTLRGIEKDLRADLIDHDKRITTLEVVHKIKAQEGTHRARSPS